MKQIFQNLRTGKIELAEVPCPQAGPGSVLIQTHSSLISAGTERMLTEFGKANLINKARQQPDKVKQVLNKIKTDGLLPTLEAVFRALDEPLPLGYCNAGVVLEVGNGVQDIKPGDRVISNGPHSEVVCVPRNLCAKISDNITDEQAVFTVLGSIALQGIRLAKPALGEKFMVFGTGLLGLLAVQLLCANGCEVLAVDLNSERLKLAQQFGAKIVDINAGGDPVVSANTWTGGNGVDGVLITASSKTDQIMHQAAQVSRKRGRVVLVGVVGLGLQRSDFYEKEISFQVSCSYGPGRYDQKYEQEGQDYPYGYVRWTEQRNFEAVLKAISLGRLKVDELITDRFSLTDAVSAYEKIQNVRDSLGVILQYSEEVNHESEVIINKSDINPAKNVVVGVIGAGNFSKTVLLPSLSKTSAHIACIADTNSAAAYHAARKFKADRAVTDYKTILKDPKINTVFIAVRHDIHARLLCEALEAGKHVFVEKPLAINKEELERITKTVTDVPDKLLMVGFNRRFSPHTVKIKKLLIGRNEPLCMNMTVNAGYIPPDHWTQDPKIGGGRIIGEACHFIDLLSFLSDSRILSVSAAMMGSKISTCNDNLSITLGFDDGSVGIVNYFANGSKKYPKETLEIFSERRVLRLDNFRSLSGYGFNGFRGFKALRQDKGHHAEIKTFVDSVASGGQQLIPFAELLNVTRASFAAVESALQNQTIIL